MAHCAPATQAEVQTVVVPSKLQIALAFAILVTKPDGITVRDYFVQLRSYMKQGRQQLVEEGQHRHIDSVAYWREQYKSAEVKCHELEQRNVQLERANDALHRKQETTGIAESLKRKGELRKHGGPAKRLKGPQNVAENLGLGAQDTVAGDLDDVLDGLGEAGATLVQTLYTGHKLYTQHIPDPKAVCFNLVQLSRAIGSVVSTIAKHHDQLVRGRPSISLEKDTSEMAFATRATARAFTSLLVGLGKIANNGTDRQLPNLVICECVRMFRNILDSISESARMTVVTRTTAQAKSNNSRNKTPASIKESNAPQNLARLLNAFMSYLDKTDPNHREMFEGLLFVVLERVGKRLFYCTFGRNRSATIEGDIALSPVHDHPSVIARQEAEAMAGRLEFRSLVTILERAIALAPNHINPRSATFSSSTRSGLARTLTMKTLPASSKTPLSTQAKDRLQRTLIKCMFGQEDRDEFSDVLRMPARLGGLPNVAKVEDKDVNGWFQGEVWRLVGWELLGREGGW